MGEVRRIGWEMGGEMGGDIWEGEVGEERVGGG